VVCSLSLGNSSGGYWEGVIRPNARPGGTPLLSLSPSLPPSHRLARCEKEKEEEKVKELARHWSKKSRITRKIMIKKRI
jgi:hypothetical protein